MTRRKGLGAAVAAAVLGCIMAGTALAQTPSATATATATPSPLPTIVASNLCNITGQVIDVNGNVAYNEEVYFQTLGVQNTSGFITRGGSAFSVFTDGNGNLPANVYLVKRATVQVTVGNTQPVSFQVPTGTSADLSTLILANNDPPSVVSGVACAPGSDVGCSVVNPSSGAIGTSTITFGQVTGLQGIPICSTAPAANQLLGYNATNANWCPTNTIGNLVGNTTGGPFGITNENWNNVIDPRAYGCHNDVKSDYNNNSTTVGVTVTQNSTSLTSTDHPWTANDCHTGSGCTGPNDKIIRIERGFAAPSLGTDAYTSYTGKIVNFINSGSVTLSTNYTDASEGGDEADWGTADDVTDSAGHNCVAAINTATQSNLPANAGNIEMQISVPILLTTTWNFNNMSGWVNGAGMAMQVNESTTPSFSPGIYDFSTVPDQPIVQRTNSDGLSISNLVIIGETINQPSWCIEDVDNSSLQRPGPNVLNSDYNVTCGGAFGLGGIEQGAGLGSAVPSANTIVGQTSVAVTGSITAPTGLGPNSPVYVLDNTGGREVAYTAPTYVRNANPIVFINGLTNAHTASNTTFYWGAGPVIHAFGTDVTTVSGSNNERHRWYNVSARYASACLTNGSPNASDMGVYGIDCTGDLIGLNIPNGGTLNVSNMQSVGTCLESNMAGSFATIKIDGSTVQRATNDACGPSFRGGFSPQVPGLAMVLTSTAHQEARASGGPTYINYTNINGDGNLGGNEAPNGVLFDLAPIGNLRTMRLENYALGNNLASGANPPAVSAFINVLPKPGAVVISGSWYSLDSSKHLSFIDPGLADNRYQRRYDLDEKPTFIGEMPAGIHQTLMGSTAFVDVPNEIDTPGFLSNAGILNQNALQSGSILSAVFTGTTDTHDCWYRIAFDVNGQLSKPPNSSVLGRVNCAGTLNNSNFVSLTAIAPPGAQQLHVYRAKCTSDPCVDPGGELELSNSPFPINRAYSASFAPLTIQDNVDGSLGSGFPTTEGTGTITAANNLTFGGDLVSATTIVPAPTLTAGCNSTGSSVAGTDFMGVITTQSSGAATTCTLTKGGPACANAYQCLFTDANGSTSTLAYSAGATTASTAIVDFASATSAKINYLCSCR